MSGNAPPLTGVMHRFSRFIEGLKRAMTEGIRPREDTLAAMAVPLWNYLGRTLRRLAALHARFAAGTLAPASNRSDGPRPASDRPTPVRRPPCIPPGPVLLRYRLVHFVAPLRELLDDPEMRALLAASPQAGRLLRPLWRKLITDPLPEPLRLPPKPRQPKPPCPAPPKPARATPASRPAWPPASPLPAPLWPDPAPATTQAAACAARLATAAFAGLTARGWPLMFLTDLSSRAASPHGDQRAPRRESAAAMMPRRRASRIRRSRRPPCRGLTASSACRSSSWPASRAAPPLASVSPSRRRADRRWSRAR